MNGELILRVVLGRLVVSAFSLLGDLLRPKTLAGLFSVAPSVALATTSIALSTKGAEVASNEHRSTVFGAIALGCNAFIIGRLLLRGAHPRGPSWQDRRVVGTCFCACVGSAMLAGRSSSLFVTAAGQSVWFGHIERMQDYNHYAAIGVLGEILPDERNFVSLHPTERDRYGLPAPYAHFNLFDNDRQMMQAGIQRARKVLEAAGATETHAVNRYAHLVGTCRMGPSAADSVVDQWYRTWDVPNLLVCDGSVLPTQGSANPAITISALAARTADWLRQAAANGDLHVRSRTPPKATGS